MNVEYETLIVRKDGGILEVVLNRPERRNAVNFQMTDELHRVLREVMTDDDVRVVTLRGAGPHFCSGHDILEDAEDLVTTGQLRGVGDLNTPGGPNFWWQAWNVTKPLVAGVHGYVGPQAQMLLAHFDFVIAAEGTRFSFEDVRRGSFIRPWGSPLIFQLPMRVWKKLMLMGGWLDAEQALQFQYVQRVVPIEELENETRRWADEIVKFPTKQLQAAKENVHRQYELMGLVNMEFVHNKAPRYFTEEEFEVARKVMESGVKGAITSRDDPFDDDIARI